MALACQRDPYLKRLDAVVQSCEAATLVKGSGKLKTKLTGFEIILNDTVLFPEGGGQPDDHGKVGSVDIINVSRRGAEAVHFSSEPLPVGESVRVCVDWGRRFDHMQQHSGQHLLTAVMDRLYGHETTSWNMGERVSFIELNTDSLTEEEMETVERETNNAIRASTPVVTKYYDSLDDPVFTEGVRARGLPDDHVGPVRVVTIEGIDSNMCCGTHVSNMAHLQALKLLGWEKSKTKGRVNLLFVVGDRVLSQLGRSHSNEKVVASLLKTSPDEIATLVAKLQLSAKLYQRSFVSVQRDLAVLEGARLAAEAAQSNTTFISYHRKEVDNEFMNIVANGISDEKIVTFISVGDEKGIGNFLLCGPHVLISKVAPEVLQLLDGKGACKNGRCQGRANKLNQKVKAEEVIRKAFSAENLGSDHL